LSRFVSGVVILVALAAALPARADDWPDPAKWDGKSPLKGPNSAEFYKLTSIRAALVRMAGDQFYRHVILEWTEYSKIIAGGDGMIVWGCKPHACDAHQVATIVQGRKISVCTSHISAPNAIDSKPRASDRLWFMEDAWMPVVERDPPDGEGCEFRSVKEAATRLQNARATMWQR
jgi:hypothetical protein